MPKNNRKKKSSTNNYVSRFKAASPKKKFLVFIFIFGLIGSIFLYRSFAATTLVGSDGEFHSVNPARILDTRSANGISTKTPVGPQKTISVQVTGRGGIPSNNVKSVVMNVSAVAPSATSTLIVWPSGASRPGVASVNFTAGQGITNQITVPVGSDGKVQIYNSGGNTHVVLDVAGYIVGPNGPQGSRLHAMSPTRILDTRSAKGVTTKTPIAAGKSISLKVTDVADVPSDASSVVLNLTAVAPTANGTLIAWPFGSPRPGVASINFTANRGITNQITVPVGSDGMISIYNSSGNTHAVAEIAGYYVRSVSSLSKAQGGRTVAVTPKRFYDSRSADNKTPISSKSYKTLYPAKSGEVDGYRVKAVLLNVSVVNPDTTGTLTVYPSTGRTPVIPPSIASMNFSAKQGITNQLVVPIGAYGAINFHNNSSGKTHMVVDIAGYVLQDTYVGINYGTNYQNLYLTQTDANRGRNNLSSVMFNPTKLNTADGDVISPHGLMLSYITTDGYQGSGNFPQIDPVIKFTGGNGQAIIESTAYAYSQDYNNFISSISTLSSNAKLTTDSNSTTRRFELPYNFVAGRSYKFSYQIYENSAEYGAGKWIVTSIQDMGNGVVTQLLKANLSLMPLNVSGIGSEFNHRAGQGSISCSSPRQIAYTIGDYKLDRPFDYSDSRISDPFNYNYVNNPREICPGAWSSAYRNNPSGKPELSINMGIPSNQRDITGPTVNATKQSNKINIVSSDPSGVVHSYAEVLGESMNNISANNSCYGCLGVGFLTVNNMVTDFTGSDGTLNQYQNATNITEYRIKAMDSSYNVTEVSIPK